MAPLTFADTYNMIAFLTKSDASERFDQIVDFLNAHTIQYALMVNPPIYVSCIKQFWASVLVKKANDVVKLQALFNMKKVVITKDTIRQALRLDDADSIECLPNEEIFTELTRMGYEKPPPNMVRNVDSPSKFLMYLRFLQVMINAQVDDLSSHNTKCTSPALTQKVFANIRRIVSAALTQPSPTQAPSPSPQGHITSSPQAQPAPPSSPPSQQPTQPADTSKSSMTILNTLMETCATLSQKIVKSSNDTVVDTQEDVSKQRRGGRIAKLDADEGVILVDVDVAVEMDADTQGRIEEDVTATKEVNTAEPTVFDDDEVIMTMDQILIKIKVKKQRILDEQMAKRLQDKEIAQATARERQKKEDLERAKVPSQENMIVYLKNMDGYKLQHFKSMTYHQVRPIFKREYNHVQTFLKSDRDEEPTKKRAAKETLLQESFKKLRAEVKVSVVEFKVEALQVKYPLIDWEIHFEGSRSYCKIIRVGGITEAYQSFEDMLKSFDRYMHDPLSWKLYTNYGVHQVTSTRRHHIFMLTEKDYPLTDVVLLLMLSAKLQVDEECEMARSLMMKIFLKANQPKSKSLDTSSN
nr:hypothetical protein [Tanacetum cinerariifolium]